MALAAYAVLLWYRPGTFLLVLPIVLPALDLGLWTGWMMVSEPDLFILTTIIVLLIRDPPRRADWHMSHLPTAVALALAASWLIATATGLLSTLPSPPSDNAFLRPDNAIRLAKPLLEAIALFPFLRARQRRYGDAITLLSYGFATGLSAVTLIVLAERAMFTGIWDTSAAYRVAGPFSSMRVGGGHIGAYTALALPFCLCLFQMRPRWQGIILGGLACLGGGYTLAVTFARTAYAAGAVSMAIAALGWLWAANRQSTRSAAFGTLPVALVLAGLAGAAALTGMYDRFAASTVDFLVRQDNWRAGMAVRDHDLPTTLFGMGLGTYQRAMLARSPINRPSNLVVNNDQQGAYISMRVETPFFLGQKISIPNAGPLHLTAHARASDGTTTFSASICDKVLLYSDNCQSAQITLAEPNQWTTLTATLPTAELGSHGRPVELSLFGPIGHTIDIRDITLTDESGHQILSNGNFHNNLDRWLFTDDSHVSWRMFNQYLMLVFETGILGLATYLALAGIALAGGILALRGGSLTGAAVTASIAGFIISGLFDNLLEAPRLATMFFLICSCGLMQWDAKHL